MIRASVLRSQEGRRDWVTSMHTHVHTCTCTHARAHTHVHVDMLTHGHLTLWPPVFVWIQLHHSSKFLVWLKYLYFEGCPEVTECLWWVTCLTNGWFNLSSLLAIWIEKLRPPNHRLLFVKDRISPANQFYWVAHVWSKLNRLAAVRDSES